MKNTSDTLKSECTQVIKKGICPNQYVGTPKSIIEEKKFTRKNIDFDELSKLDKILIILESPHTCEYEGDSIEPAKGLTGENIVNWMPQLVKCCKDLFDNESLDDREIYLINAIPYQCSLGETDRTKTRKRFRMLWDPKNEYNLTCDCKFRINFEKNLRQLLESKGKIIIINCVTSNLKGLVTTAINKVIKQRDVKFLISTHPSWWGKSPKYRYINYENEKYEF